MIDENVISSEIIKHHREYFRDFPWRKNISPYKLLIAELMLRRTKAKQVIPVYNNFIEKYPDINYLGLARLSDIQKIIQPLGLHWRAESFIDSVNYIQIKHNGQFPDTEQEIKNIPGVGNYITGAILTVCFKTKYPVIDSNIARFINRYYGLGLSGEIRRNKQILVKANELFSIKNTENLLFPLVDFTALICKPRKPICENCFLKEDCMYFQHFLL
ncbi:MAG: DNA glycosylase [Candidatus Margulisbacteria bacterium]|jgi:A/G-specific adenine glycosylase|nr:DNA glycosylase [Candidatus Margulisiibacteriota bacterium]